MTCSLSLQVDHFTCAIISVSKQSQSLPLRCATLMSITCYYQNMFTIEGNLQEVVSKTEA